MHLGLTGFEKGDLCYTWCNELCNYSSTYLKSGSFCQHAKLMSLTVFFPISRELWGRIFPVFGSQDKLSSPSRTFRAKFRTSWHPGLDTCKSFAEKAAQYTGIWILLIPWLFRLLLRLLLACVSQTLYHSRQNLRVYPLFAHYTPARKRVREKKKKRKLRKEERKEWQNNDIFINKIQAESNSILDI